MIEYANYYFAYVLIRYDTIQKRQTKVNFLCVCSLKPIIFEDCYDTLSLKTLAASDERFS